MRWRKSLLTKKTSYSSSLCNIIQGKRVKPGFALFGQLHGGFNNRSRRREEADFCNKSSSASSRRRLRRLGRFLNPPLASWEFLFPIFNITVGRVHRRYDSMNVQIHVAIT